MKYTLTPTIHIRQKGVAAIEMAILLPLLILVFTGMIEYGRLMWHYDALAKATRDAARYLSKEEVNSAAIDTALLMVDNAADAAGVKDLVPGNDENDGDVRVSCHPGCGNPERVTVSVIYGFKIGEWVPIIGPLSSSVFEVNLTPHTTMPYLYGH